MPNASAHTTQPSGNELHAIYQLQTVLESANVTTAAGLDPTQICQTYQKIRPVLSTAVAIIRNIPVIGPTIANALQTLMTLLDGLCGTS